MNDSKPPQLNQSSKSLALVFLLIALIGVMLAFRQPSTSHSPWKGANVTDSTLTYQDYPTPANQPKSSLAGYILRTTLTLGLLFVALYFGLRFYRNKMRTSQGSSGSIRLAGKFYFNPKQYLVAVIWKERELLLGVTENQITRLSEIDLNEGIDDFPEQPPIAEKRA